VHREHGRNNAVCLCACACVFCKSKPQNVALGILIVSETVELFTYTDDMEFAVGWPACRAVTTLSDVHWKNGFLPRTGVFSALEIIYDDAL